MPKKTFDLRLGSLLVCGCSIAIDEGLGDKRSFGDI